MTRRGWGGSPPADDDEARQRIVEAAMRCVDRLGPQHTNLADVASELSITRQTVYRYFASTEELFIAVGVVAVEDFFDDLTSLLRRRTDPADWVVEALATAIERLPNERNLTLLLATGNTRMFTAGMTSAAGLQSSRTLLERSPIDWEAAGFTSEDVDGIVEVMVRLLQSMILEPSDPPRSGPELRRFLRRWIAPAIVPAHTLSEA